MATVRINPPGTYPAAAAGDHGGGERRVGGGDQQHPGGGPPSGDAPGGVAVGLLAGGRQRAGARTLSAVSAGSETPQRTARVTYMPAADFGAESSNFRACGTVSSALVCISGRR